MWRQIGTLTCTLQSENVLEVAKRAKRSLADSFNTMVRRKVITLTSLNFVSRPRNPKSDKLTFLIIGSKLAGFP